MMSQKRKPSADGGLPALGSGGRGDIPCESHSRINAPTISPKNAKKHAKNVHVKSLIAALRHIYPSKTRELGAALLNAKVNYIHHLLYTESFAISDERYQQFAEALIAKLGRMDEAARRAALIDDLKGAAGGRDETFSSTHNGYGDDDGGCAA